MLFKMRVITLNMNGVRAAARKGFFEWLRAQKADFVCLQEIKADYSVLEDDAYHPDGYHCYYRSAVTKKGYSGVAIYSLKEPKRIIDSLGWDCVDQEGRYLQADFDGLSVVSLYMPSGSSGEARQAVKFDFMDRYLVLLKKMRRSRRSFIICGDWNIVHKEIDIRNFKSNQKHSGCLPKERAWLDYVFTRLGFVDAFRVVNQESGQYTWWSNRGRSWATNVGWRLDYQVTTPNLKSKVRAAYIYKKQRFSDHAPLIVDYQ